MTREESIQILQLYKDEIKKRLGEAESTFEKEMCQWQMDGFDLAIETLRTGGERRDS